MNRVPHIYKWIAIFTALCVECTSLSIPLAHAEVLPQSAPSIKKINPELLKLPTKFGEVVESHSGNGTVIIVQDAHAIPDAQRNIANVIKFVQQEYGVGTVALEGASGDLDPQIFRSFPDKKLLRQVMKGYMDAGEIAGGTASAVFDETPTKYVGVEDWDVYEEGLGLYLSAMDKEPELLKKLNAERLKLDAEKEKSYSKELLEIDQAVEKFYENAAQLTDLIKLLGAVQAPQAGSELDALWKEVSKQTTDQRLTTNDKDIEVRALARKVEKFLKAETPRGLPAASPEVAQPARQQLLKNFNSKKQEWMTGEISAEAFALYLKETAQKLGLKLEMSSELHGMVKDQHTLKGIEGTKLFKELETYIREVKQQLIERSTSHESRATTGDPSSGSVPSGVLGVSNYKARGLTPMLLDLDQRTESLRSLTKLAKLELSREEWKQLKAKGTDPYVALGTGSVPIDTNDLVFHLAFYLNAEERDEIFFKNLVANQEPGTKNQAIQMIVAGGFHAEGLTSRLKDAGIGYALVMPKINHIPENIAYQAQMRGEVSWKDYFEVENGRIHLYKAFVRATRDRLLAKGTVPNAGSGTGTVPDVQILKAWRDQIIRDLSDQGKVQRAAFYTRYMDEMVNEELKHTDADKLMSKVDNFIRGLRGLEKANQLNSEQIAALLKANMLNAATSVSLGQGTLSEKPTTSFSFANNTVSQAGLGEFATPIGVPAPSPELVPSIDPDVVGTKIKGAKSRAHQNQQPHIPTTGLFESRLGELSARAWFQILEENNIEIIIVRSDQFSSRLLISDLTSREEFLLLPLKPQDKKSNIAEAVVEEFGGYATGSFFARERIEKLVNYDQIKLNAIGVKTDTQGVIVLHTDISKLSSAEIMHTLVEEALHSLSSVPRDEESKALATGMLGPEEIVNDILQFLLLGKTEHFHSVKWPYTKTSLAVVAALRDVLFEVIRNNQDAPVAAVMREMERLFSDNLAIGKSEVGFKNFILAQEVMYGKNNEVRFKEYLSVHGKDNRYDRAEILREYLVNNAQKNRSEARKYYDDLEKSIVALEDRVKKIDVNELPALGFHGHDESGKTKSGYYYYFVYNDLVSRFSRQDKLKPEEFLRRLQGTIMFTMAYSKPNWGNGKYPVVHLLVEREGHTFNSRNFKSASEFDFTNPVTLEQTKFPYFAHENERQISEIPPASIKTIALSPSYFREFNQLADELAKPEVGFDRELVLKSVTERLFYKLALEEILKIEERRANIKNQINAIWRNDEQFQKRDQLLKLLLGASKWKSAPGLAFELLKTSGNKHVTSSDRGDMEKLVKGEDFAQFLSKNDLGEILSQFLDEAGLDLVKKGQYEALIVEITVDGAASAGSRAEMSAPLTSEEAEIQERITFLEKTKIAWTDPNSPELIMVGDQHGKPADLLRVLVKAKAAVKNEKNTRVIINGDFFDRGENNKTNWQILQKLVELADKNENIEVDLLWGNHDVWLVQAILLKDKESFFDWCLNGGHKVLEEFGFSTADEAKAFGDNLLVRRQRRANGESLNEINQKIQAQLDSWWKEYDTADESRRSEILSLAKWLMQNLKFHTADDEGRGFVSVHAGIPMDHDINLQITRENLDEFQARLNAIQDQFEAGESNSTELEAAKKALEQLFKDAAPVFWTREHEWTDLLMKDLDPSSKEGQKRAQLIQEVKKRVTTIFTNNLKEDEKEHMSPEKIAEIVNEKLEEMVREFMSELTSGSDAITFEQINELFKREKPTVDPVKMDAFLRKLGAAGVIAGHIHLRDLGLFDGRIIIIDVEGNEAGHLIFNRKGISFHKLSEDAPEVKVTLEAVLKGIDEQIDRLKKILSDIGLAKNKNEELSAGEKRERFNFFNAEGDLDNTDWNNLKMRDKLISTGTGTIREVVSRNDDGSINFKTTTITKDQTGKTVEKVKAETLAFSQLPVAKTAEIREAVLNAPADKPAFVVVRARSEARLPVVAAIAFASLFSGWIAYNHKGEPTIKPTGTSTLIAEGNQTKSPNSFNVVENLAGKQVAVTDPEKWEPEIEGFDDWFNISFDMEISDAEYQAYYKAHNMTRNQIEAFERLSREEKVFTVFKWHMNIPAKRTLEELLGGEASLELKKQIHEAMQFIQSHDAELYQVIVDSIKNIVIAKTNPREEIVGKARMDPLMAHTPTGTIYLTESYLERLDDFGKNRVAALVAAMAHEAFHLRKGKLSPASVFREIASIYGVDFDNSGAMSNLLADNVVEELAARMATVDVVRRAFQLSGAEDKTASVENIQFEIDQVKAGPPLHSNEMPRGYFQRWIIGEERPNWPAHMQLNPGLAYEAMKQAVSQFETLTGEYPFIEAANIGGSVDANDNSHGLSITLRSKYYSGTIIVEKDGKIDFIQIKGELSGNVLFYSKEGVISLDKLDGGKAEVKLGIEMARKGAVDYLSRLTKELVESISVVEKDGNVVIAVQSKSFEGILSIRNIVEIRSAEIKKKESGDTVYLVRDGVERINEFEAGKDPFAPARSEIRDISPDERNIPESAGTKPSRSEMRIVDELRVPKEVAGPLNLSLGNPSQTVTVSRASNGAVSVSYKGDSGNEQKIDLRMGQTVQIGREPNLLELGDKVIKAGNDAVSRQHVSIYHGHDGVIVIRDLNSTNGTVINEDFLTAIEVNKRKELLKPQDFSETEARLMLAMNVVLSSHEEALSEAAKILANDSASKKIKAEDIRTYLRAREPANKEKFVLKRHELIKHIVNSKESPLVKISTLVKDSPLANLYFGLQEYSVVDVLGARDSAYFENWIAELEEREADEITREKNNAALDNLLDQQEAEKQNDDGGWKTVSSEIVTVIKRNELMGKIKTNSSNRPSPFVIITDQNRRINIAPSNFVDAQTFMKNQAGKKEGEQLTQEETNSLKLGYLEKTVAVALELLLNPENREEIFKNNEAFLTDGSVLERGVGYHRYEPVSPMQMLRYNSWIKFEASKDTESQAKTRQMIQHFQKNGNLGQYIDGDIMLDLMALIGGKSESDHGVMAFIADYLRTIYEFETTTDETVLKQKLRVLARNYHKFAGFVDFGRLKNWNAKSASFKYAEDHLLTEVATKNFNVAKSLPGQSTTDSKKDPVERFRAALPPGWEKRDDFILDDITYRLGDRLFMLAARDGKIEMYYSSSTYSRIAGQNKWSKMEAVIMVKNKETQQYDNSSWIFKPALENLHDLPLEANKKINDFIVNGQIKEDTMDRSALIELFISSGVGTNAIGNFLTRGPDGKVVPSNLWADLDRYPALSEFTWMVSHKEGLSGDEIEEGPVFDYKEMIKRQRSWRAAAASQAADSSQPIRSEARTVVDLDEWKKATRQGGIQVDLYIPANEADSDIPYASEKPLLKVFKGQAAGIQEKHIQVLEAIFKQFKEDETLKEIIPAMEFVRVKSNGQMLWGITMAFVSGVSLAQRLDNEWESSSEMQTTALNALRQINVITEKITGYELADRHVSTRGGETFENFIVQDERLLNIDPVNVQMLINEMSKDRIKKDVDLMLERGLFGDNFKRVFDRLIDVADGSVLSRTYLIELDTWLDEQSGDVSPQQLLSKMISMLSADGRLQFRFSNMAGTLLGTRLGDFLKADQWSLGRFSIERYTSYFGNYTKANDEGSEFLTSELSKESPELWNVLKEEITKARNARSESRARLPLPPEVVLDYRMASANTYHNYLESGRLTDREKQFVIGFLKNREIVHLLLTKGVIKEMNVNLGDNYADISKDRIYEIFLELDMTRHIQNATIYQQWFVERETGGAYKVSIKETDDNSWKEIEQDGKKYNVRDVVGKNHIAVDDRYIDKFIEVVEGKNKYVSELVSHVKDVAIITHGRERITNTVMTFAENAVKFGHATKENPVTIHVFDDKKEGAVERKGQVEDALAKAKIEGITLIYHTMDEREKFIANIIQKVLERNRSVIGGWDEQKVTAAVNQILGKGAGAQRNWLNLFFAQTPYVSLDDDMSPHVNTNINRTHGWFSLDEPAIVGKSNFDVEVNLLGVADRAINDSRVNLSFFSYSGYGDPEAFNTIKLYMENSPYSAHPLAQTTQVYSTMDFGKDVFEPADSWNNDQLIGGVVVFSGGGNVMKRPPTTSDLDGKYLRIEDFLAGEISKMLAFPKAVDNGHLKFADDDPLDVQGVMKFPGSFKHDRALGPLDRSSNYAEVALLEKLGSDVLSIIKKMYPTDLAKTSDDQDEIMIKWGKNLEEFVKTARGGEGVSDANFQELSKWLSQNARRVINEYHDNKKNHSIDPEKAALILETFEKLINEMGWDKYLGKKPTEEELIKIDVSEPLEIVLKSLESFAQTLQIWPLLIDVQRVAIPEWGKELRVPEPKTVPAQRSESREISEKMKKSGWAKLDSGAIVANGNVTNKDIPLGQSASIVAVDLDAGKGPPAYETHVIQALFFASIFYKAKVGKDKIAKSYSEINNAIKKIHENLQTAQVNRKNALTLNVFAAQAALDAALKAKREVLPLLEAERAEFLQIAKKDGFEEFLIPSGGILSRRLVIAVKNEDQRQRILKSIALTFVSQSKESLLASVREIVGVDNATNEWLQQVESFFNEFESARSFMFPGGVFHKLIDEQVAETLGEFIEVIVPSEIPQALPDFLGENATISANQDGITISQETKENSINNEAINSTLKLAKWSPDLIKNLKSLLNDEQYRDGHIRVISLGTGDPTPFSGSQDYTHMAYIRNGRIIKLTDLSNRTIQNLEDFEGENLMGRIDKIHLTHSHFDHAGGLLEIVRRKLAGDDSLPTKLVIHSAAQVQFETLAALDFLPGSGGASPDVNQIRNLFEIPKASRDDRYVETIKLEDNVEIELAPTFGHPIVTTGSKIRYRLPDGTVITMGYLADSVLPPEEIKNKDGQLVDNPRYREFVDYWADSDILISENGVAPVHISVLQLQKAFENTHIANGTLFTVHAAGEQSGIGLIRFVEGMFLTPQPKAQRADQVEWVKNTLIKSGAIKAYFPLNGNEALEIARIGTVRNFEDGELILSEGDQVERSDSIYIVLSGTADIETSSGGKIEPLGEGSVIGETALVSRHLSGKDYEAIVKQLAEADDDGVSKSFFERYTYDININGMPYRVVDPTIDLEKKAAEELTIKQKEETLKQLFEIPKSGQTIPRTATVRAGKDLVLLAIPKEAFLQFMLRADVLRIADGHQQLISFLQGMAKAKFEEIKRNAELKSAQTVGEGDVVVVTNRSEARLVTAEQMEQATTVLTGVVGFFNNPTDYTNEQIIALADAVAGVVKVLGGARLNIIEGLLRSIANDVTLLEQNSGNASEVSEIDEDQVWKTVLGRALTADFKLKDITVALDVDTNAAVIESLKAHITPELAEFISVIQLRADPALRKVFQSAGIISANIDLKTADAVAVETTLKILNKAIPQIGVINQAHTDSPIVTSRRITYQLLVAAFLAGRPDLQKKVDAGNVDHVMDEINLMLFQVGGEKGNVLKNVDGKISIDQTELAKFIEMLFKAQTAVAASA